MEITDLVATVIITALTSSGLMAAVLAASAFVAKNVFNNYLSQRLEVHKAELEKASFEHQTRFQSLHTKRAQVIDDLYGHMNQVLNNINAAVDILQYGEDSQKEKLEKAYDSGRELQNYFSRNRIYFNRAFCDKAQIFINKIYELTVDFLPVVQAVEENTNHAERLLQWKNALDSLKTDIRPLNTELEETFRELFGVT